MTSKVQEAIAKREAARADARKPKRTRKPKADKADKAEDKAEE